MMIIPLDPCGTLAVGRVGGPRFDGRGDEVFDIGIIANQRAAVKPAPGADRQNRPCRGERVRLGSCLD